MSDALYAATRRISRYFKQGIDLLIVLALGELSWQNQLLMETNHTWYHQYSQVPLIGGTPINLTLLVTLIYVVTYIMMDPVAGSLAASLVLLLHRFTFGKNQNFVIF